jgi:hypothetical protein
MSIETLAMPRSSNRLSSGSTLPLSTTSLVSAGFVALAVAMGIGRFAFRPVLPMMRHAGALSITGAAWLTSANYAGYLAGALLALLISIPTYRGDFLLNSPLTSNNLINSTKKTFDDVHTVMIIYPIQSIESAHRELDTASIPSHPHEDDCSTSVKANKEDPLTKSHQHMFPLAMVALLAAAFELNPSARAQQDVPPPISGALGQVQSVGTNATQEGNSMEAIGLLVTLEARPGKESDAEAFLKSAQPLALNEKDTLKWYASSLGRGSSAFSIPLPMKGAAMPT